MNIEIVDFYDVYGKARLIYKLDDTLNVMAAPFVMILGSSILQPSKLEQKYIDNFYLENRKILQYFIA